MAKLEKIIAEHPVRGRPYDQLAFAGLNQDRTPLYTVRGSEAGPTDALEALARAFERVGGQCFYCAAKFQPQPLSTNGAHRDHVRARCQGGKSLLHNLVIACSKCGAEKGRDAIHEYRPKAAARYFLALEDHISRCIKESGPG